MRDKNKSNTPNVPSPPVAANNNDTPVVKRDYKSMATKIALGVFMTVAVAGFLYQDINGYLGGGSPTDIAVVGKKSVTRADFDAQKQKIMERFQGMPPELIALQNPSQKAVESLIEKYALSEYARHIDLLAPQQDIADIIDGFTFFKDESTGKFSSTKYKDFLRRMGMSEQQFLDSLSDDIVRDMLVQKIMVPVSVSSDMVKIMQSHEFEKRHISYAVFDAKNIDNITPLENNDAVLKAYYEKHKNSFSRPETRNISYIPFTRDTLKSVIAPSDTDIKSYYEKNKEFYSTPEKRNILQLSFDDIESANQAYDKLKSGKNTKQEFIDSVQKLGFMLEDTELGLVTKDDFNAEISQDIFALDTGHYTKVLKNEFGYAIYYVESVKPQIIKKIADVSVEISDKLLQEKFIAFKDNNFDTIDEDFAGGATLSEIAEKYKLPVLSYDNMTGHGVDYNTNKNIISNTDLISAFFGFDENDSAAFIDLGNDEFAFGVTNKINPVRIMTYPEAKPLLIQHDKDQKINDATQKIAENIQKMINDGASLSDIAKKYDLTINTKDISRFENTAELSPDFVGILFDTAKDKIVTSDYAGYGTHQIMIARIDDIQVDKKSDDELRAVKDNLSDTVRYEIYRQMLNNMQNVVGVKINQDAYNEVVK
jgi:peptidyl-prolyl cis-trans isomerase D